MSPTNQGQVGQAKRRWCGWYLEIMTECDYGNNTLTEGWWPGLWPKQLSDKKQVMSVIMAHLPKKAVCVFFFSSSKMKTPSWRDKWRSICMNHYWMSHQSRFTVRLDDVSHFDGQECLWKGGYALKENNFMHSPSGDINHWIGNLS